MREYTLYELHKVVAVQQIGYVVVLDEVLEEDFPTAGECALSVR